MCMCFGMNCLQTVSFSLRKIRHLNHLSVKRYFLYFIRPNLARVFHYLARAEHSNFLNSFHEMGNFIP